MKQTMRQHSFISQLKSLAVVFGIALAFASCANEDVPQNPTKPNEDNDKNLTTFMAGGETRTSLNYNSGDFYWEKDDYIYVKDDDGVLQKSTNAPTQKVAAFKYMVPGKFTANTSYKVYYLGKNSDGSSVSISTAQSQAVPDNTEHFGTAGDYGTATATGTLGGGSFSFELEHQPAYLVFQPYTSNTILHDCYLRKVEVSSDNDIAETYTVNATTGALDASAGTGSKQIVLTTSGSGSYNNGFPLTNSSASVTTNGAYMVIKPGTHTLRVRYWVKDNATGTEGTITKTLPATAYASNTYYDMTANLNVHNYDGDKYYMWDAQEQYWKGHEWNLGGSQPTLMTQSASSDYPQNSSDTNNRWNNESYPGYGISNPATHTSCKDLPNANEMSWYVMYGDPRWDGDELWTTMGHLYKGGTWFKKKSVLQAENHYDTEKSADNTTDMRTTPKTYSNSNNNSGIPSAADAGKYFYLPALGLYYFGQLNDVGSEGHYWSSSAGPWNNLYAYYLHFNSSYVYATYYRRSTGYRAEALQ
mgnify:CR=1 FL=1